MTRPAADSVRVSWSGTGTGTISLGSVVTGFQAFPAALDGQIVSYAVEHENGSERENGIGTYTMTGNTLSRDLVTFSTAGAPTKVTFTVGTKNVRLSLLAQDFVENRATVDPGVNDDITAGYIEGRSRWLNTATGSLFFCLDDTGGAAVWRVAATDPGTVRALQRVTDAAEFTANRTAADTDTNLGRLRWQGTTAGRFDVPSGLAVGTDFEVVVDHDLANIAPLTVERTSGDGNRRLGGPIGCRILRPGGICRVRVFEDGVWIGGDLDPTPMAAQNGGASFLVERGLKQTVSGGVLQSWGDKYVLHNFESLTGSPGVGEYGEMSFDQALSEDAFLSESVTFAGTSLLFGLAMRIDSVTGSNVIPFTASNFATGHGFYVADSGSGTLLVNVMRDASTIIALGMDYILARPFGIGVAINRATGFVYGFFDESRANREREETITSTTFVVDWTSAAQSAQIGPALSGSQAFAGRVYAVTIRDNLTFANVNDARDQAAAMLAEMRGYYV